MVVQHPRSTRYINSVAAMCRRGREGLVRRLMRVWLAMAWTAGFAVVLGSTLPPAYAEVHPPSGDVRPVTFADVVPRTHDDRLTFEEWAFALHLDDGTRVYVTYALSHVWFLPPVCLTEVSVVGPTEDAVLYGHRESADSFNIADQVLHFGDGQKLHLDVGKGGYLKAKSDWHDDVRLDIELQKPYRGFVVGDGWYSVGVDPNARVWSSILVPYSRIEGVLERGGKGRRVRGWMVGTHHFYSRLPNHMFVHRQIVGGKVGSRAIVGVLWRENTKNSPGTGGVLAWVDRDGTGFVSRTPEISWLRTRKVREMVAPMVYAIRGEEGSQSLLVAGKVQSPKQSFALTDPLGPATTLAVRAVIGDPVTIRGQGAVEVEWLASGQTVRQKGIVFVQTDHGDR